MLEPVILTFGFLAGFGFRVSRAQNLLCKLVNILKLNFKITAWI